MAGFVLQKVKVYFRKMLGRNFLNIKYDAIKLNLVVEFEESVSTSSFSIVEYEKLRRIFDADDVSVTVRNCKYEKTRHTSAINCHNIRLIIKNVKRWPE